MATDLLEEARRDEPDKQVVSLTINGPGGQYDMRFRTGPASPSSGTDGVAAGLIAQPLP